MIIINNGDLEVKLDHCIQNLRIVGTQYPAAMITCLPNLPLPYMKEMHLEALNALKSCPTGRIIINPKADVFEFIDLKFILPALGYKKRYAEGFYYYELVLSK